VTTRTVSITEATAEHFRAIVEIERAASEGSVVALTNGASLQQALDRGHWLGVALDADTVRGWIWFSIELGRSGEYVGQIFRVAVAQHARRAGVGTALIDHANRIFTERSVASVRITVPSEDEGARMFFEAAGLRPQALTMERRL
jgi:ribosomal protein S18 acetylase RimI-like enzyme